LGDEEKEKVTYSGSRNLLLRTRKKKKFLAYKERGNSVDWSQRLEREKRVFGGNMNFLWRGKSIFLGGKKNSKRKFYYWGKKGEKPRQRKSIGLTTKGADYLKGGGESCHRAKREGEKSIP